MIGPRLQELSCNQRLARCGVTSRSEIGRPSPRSAQTAIRTPRPNGYGLRRREGKFGLGKDIGQAVGLRRKFSILAKPPCQTSFGHFGNPLLQQCADFFAQIGGVIQARKLKAFERTTRCFAQIIPRRNDAATSHNWKPPSETRLSGTVSTLFIIKPANSNRFTLALWKSIQQSLYAGEREPNV